MSTNFDTSFTTNDTIDADHIKQYSGPVNNLESGGAFYREATSSGAKYVVGFTASDIPGGSPGHTISSLSAGQMVLFKADVASSASAELEINLEGGGATSAPLFKDGAQVGAGDISADQIVLAVYNDTSTPRFDVM